MIYSGGGKRYIMNGQEYFTKVFVYGTLMKGNSNHRFLDGTKYIGSARIAGYSMFEVTKHYPGIVHGSDDIYGEVYEINKDVLNRLDGLEGEGFLYKRIVDKAVTDDGTEHDVYIYLWMKDVKGLEKTKITPWVPLHKRECS